MKYRNKIKRLLSNYPLAYLIAKNLYLAFLNSSSEYKFFKNKSHEKRTTSFSLHSYVELLRARVEKQTCKLESFDFLQGVNLTILIPVYNHFDKLEILLRQLEKEISTFESEYNAVIRVVIADDNSAKTTRQRLSSLNLSKNFEIFFNDTNLGFIGNVNKHWKTNKGDFVCLLNSDVEIHKGFLKAMLSPFFIDTSIALVTSLTFEQFAKQLPRGATRNELAKYLSITSENQTSFIDACTAVGYALCIRDSAIIENFLFDPIYGMGYGEDSDLHYRIVERNLRSVWTLDTVVGHEGGTSFDFIDGIDAQRSKSRKFFLDRWGIRYSNEIETHERGLESAIIQRIEGFSSDFQNSIWMLLPGYNNNSGGLIVAAELLSDLHRVGTNVKVVLVNSREKIAIGGAVVSSNFADMFEHFYANKLIVVGSQSLQEFQNYSSKLTFRRIFYFAQGPDWLIDPSTSAAFFECFDLNIDFISTSAYMSKQISIFTGESEIVPYIPSTNHVLYSGLYRKNEFDFILFHRNEHGKAGWLTLVLAEILSTNYKVLLISTTPLDQISKGITLAITGDRNIFLKCLSQAAVYIDTSLFEGFGLVPREAAILGLKVLLFSGSGAPLELFKHSKHFYSYNTLSDMFDICDAAANILNEPECSGCDFCQQNYSHDNLAILNRLRDL